jgi:hypothetical protein
MKDEIVGKWSASAPFGLPLSDNPLQENLSEEARDGSECRHFQMRHTGTSLT